MHTYNIRYQIKAALITLKNSYNNGITLASVSSCTFQWLRKEEKKIPSHRHLTPVSLNRLEIYYNVLKATLGLRLFYRKILDSIASLCQQHKVCPDEIFYSLGYFCGMFYLQVLFHFRRFLHLLILFYLCGLNGSL